MSRDSVLSWTSVHTGSSLVCTLFALMLCITGLPLIFHDEIEAALNPQAWSTSRSAGVPLTLDTLLAGALARRPGEVPLFMSFDEDRPVVNITTGPTPDAPESEMHLASFDRYSGELLPPAARGKTLLHILLRLHTDMFMGLPGTLFLGAMGVALAVAVVSGLVLYAPFMRRLPFGTLRRHRSARLKWLDYHNLLGIVSVAWVITVGLTGVINALAAPLTALWQQTELADLMTRQREVLPVEKLASLDAAVAAAAAAAPARVLQFVAFPGGAFSTPGHYAIFLHGNTPLTAQLLTPALVDATSGALVGVRDMPWYLKMLALSRPLHFGDYGGLPLKLLWAGLTLLTLVVLGSGLYLWVVRRRSRAATHGSPLSGEV